MALSLKQKEKFFKKEKNIPKVITKHIKKRELILFGQRSVNLQLPTDLRKETKDFDVFTPTPKKSAKRLERKLDRKFSGDFFNTKQARHPGTYKVKTKIGDKTVADFSKPKNKVQTVKKNNIRIATINFQKKRIRASLKDPASKFRRAKDLEVRDRIRVAESRKKQRGKR